MGPEGPPTKVAEGPHDFCGRAFSPDAFCGRAFRPDAFRSGRNELSKAPLNAARSPETSN
ncbi:hypothetical protein [Lysobacter gummosus]|uniref:hypothetical protein n=1 Tax=Lysobacter gummosus TaxID=262324 RepID=UPI003CCD8136